MADFDPQAPFDSNFLARLERLHLCSRRVFSGRQQAQHGSRKLGSGLEFADHRAYSPGDDPRLLDWNLFGRTGRLYTKLFHKEEDRNLFFLLDVSGSMGAEGHKFDYVRKLAAAIAYISLSEMDRVFLAGFSDGITVSRPALRGRRAIVEALRFLAGLQAAGKTDFISTCRDFRARHGASEGMVLVFSDFMHPEGVQSALESLFRAGFDVLALHIVTPEELKPPMLGQWRLTDPEGARPVNVHITRGMVSRYKKVLSAYSTTLRKYLQARRGG